MSLLLIATHIFSTSFASGAAVKKGARKTMLRNDARSSLSVQQNEQQV